MQGACDYWPPTRDPPTYDNFRATFESSSQQVFGPFGFGNSCAQSDTTQQHQYGEPVKTEVSEFPYNVHQPNYTARLEQSLGSLFHSSAFGFKDDCNPYEYQTNLGWSSCSKTKTDRQPPISLETKESESSDASNDSPALRALLTRPRGIKSSSPYVAPKSDSEDQAVPMTPKPQQYSGSEEVVTDQISPVRDTNERGISGKKFGTDNPNPNVNYEYYPWMKSVGKLH